jgi:hypothetical protein
MKRFTLLLALLTFVVLSFGQRVKVNKGPGLPYSSELTTPVPEPRESSFKAGGEVFYRETFNWKNDADPKGWTAPEGFQIVEETDFGMPWIWRAGTDSILGMLTFEPGHAYSLTPEDGYFVLPMDEYNYRDGIDTSNGPITWFQLPPIDCSTHPGVILTLRQFFRLYPNTDIKVGVSNDLGVHWAYFNLSYETPVSIFCKNPYPEINISEVAAGMPNVWIKFIWNGLSRYFWCIDDIQLMESYNNDLVMENSWQYMTDLDDTDNDEGFVYMVPASQIGTDNFGGYTFAGAFLNQGLNDQEGSKLNVEVFKNGTSVYNETSEKRDIWAVNRDTFQVTKIFNPDGYGDYHMVLTGQADQPDERPLNNSYSDTFYITDSIYSVCDWTWEEHSSTAAWGNNDGDCMGIAYDIKKACEVNSISCVIMQRPKNKVASTQVGYNFQYRIFRYDEVEAAWIEFIQSEFAEVTQEMIDTWVTLPLEKDGESEFLEPGYYIAAIETYHNGGTGSPSNRFWRFTIGADQSHRYSYGKTVFRRFGNTEWEQNDELAMIRLNISATGAPTSVDVMFNVDMTLPIANGVFKPASDYLDVAGSFNGWDGTAHRLTDPDGDGIYSLTVPGFATFQKIEYKYRINGNWNTSEFPSGGPNRVYRTSYYNMLHDVYNNGISMGVDLSALTSSVSVYPNPSEGQFTLSVTNEQVTDLNISVTNIQGQVVYQNQVKSVMDYQENINLTEFARGMYFLKVNNQVIKVVVD